MIYIVFIFVMQIFEDLRERYFGPSFELQSHEKVSFINVSIFMSFNK